MVLLGLCLAALWGLTRRRAKPPRLVVVLAIDQFRYDYLTRSSASTPGAQALWKTGAVFTNAHFQHFPTVTAVGHSTI